MKNRPTYLDLVLKAFACFAVQFAGHDFSYDPFFAAKVITNRDEICRAFGFKAEFLEKAYLPDHFIALLELFDGYLKNPYFGLSDDNPYYVSGICSKNDGDYQRRESVRVLLGWNAGFGYFTEVKWDDRRDSYLLPFLEKMHSTFIAEKNMMENLLAKF